MLISYELFYSAQDCDSAAGLRVCGMLVFRWLLVLALRRYWHILSSSALVAAARRTVSAKATRIDGAPNSRSGSLRRVGRTPSAAHGTGPQMKTSSSTRNAHGSA